MKISFKYLAIILFFFLISQNGNSLAFDNEAKDAILSGMGNFSWTDNFFTEKNYLNQLLELPHTKIIVE
ncbi:hypothetical protein [Cyclobacterium plantarum]|uniref:Uncharacterized protein n=1 Tax=Cyclobacterium plantarum TaxID=2716263 RepID=A0ABX0HAQ3_9BACT|nr:hypothetical protein [Cyclobacterium plantarum]NHE57438.1 hypothetical protein [Cyclobacterium plantarum]